jgi:hypothetical protein
MDILCPTVTYTLNYPQHGIHQVIISYQMKSTDGHRFNILLHDESGKRIGCPGHMMMFRINSYVVVLDGPNDYLISDEPQPMPYKDVIEPVFKKYVDEHVPKPKHISQVFHVPIPTEQIVKNVMDRLEEDLDQQVDYLIKNEPETFGKVWGYLVRYPLLGNGEEVVHQLGPILGVYGLEVETIGRNGDHVLFIRACHRPIGEFQDTKIGKAVTRYMDEWEPAHAAMLLAQSKLGQ